MTAPDVAKGSKHRIKYEIAYDDRRYDTLVHMATDLAITDVAFWEIAVPNGTYKVNLVLGDSRYVDQVNNVMLEGVVLNDPDGEDHFDMYYDVTVEVTDGRLTLKQAPGGHNVKLCFIEISE